jgi:hypothetical protein
VFSFSLFFAIQDAQSKSNTRELDEEERGNWLNGKKERNSICPI